MLPDNFQPYLLNKPVSNTVNMTTSGTTDLLTAGQLGIYTCPPQTGVYGSAIAAGTATPCIIASGSWHTVDAISPLWGGLLEPDYTKIIDWKRVTAFYYSLGTAAQNQVVAFGWNMTSGSTVGPVFNCGTTYNFQLEVSGNPALNFLNHQMYKTFAAFSGCCGNGCTSGCTTTYVDAASVMLQWKDGMNQDPYWPSFVNPQVYIQTSAGTAVEVFSALDVSAGRAVTAYVPNTSTPNSVVASLKISVAYVETRFGKCTFDPTDKFEIEPLTIQGSLFTQDANPCAINTTIDTSVPTMFTELTAASQTRGLGQQIARNLILWGNYKQENFSNNGTVDGLRFREIEDDWILPNTSISGIYDTLYLRWNIYRSYNSQSTTDNDEYALTIYFPSGTVITPFTNLINSCLSTANNFIQLTTI